jgi:H+/Cl- antiporter ClcA
VRFYELIQVELKKQVAWHEIIYILVVILLGLAVFMADIHLDTLVEINGAVFGYCNSILLPILLHLKCVHYDRSSGTIEGDHEHNAQITPNGCQCDHRYSSKWTLYFETFLLVFICVAGFGLMVQSILSKLPN